MKNHFLVIVILLFIFGCQSEDNTSPSITITAIGLTDDILPLNATATFTTSISDYDGDTSALSYRWILNEENAQLADGIIALDNPFIGGSSISCIGILEGDEQIVVEALDSANNVIARSSYNFMISGPNFGAGCFDQAKFIYSYNNVNNPYICNLDSTDAQSLPFNFDVVISPDGQWYGYINDSFDGYTARVQRCDGSEMSIIPESFGRDFRPRFSPDSKTLYFHRPNPLQGDLNQAISYTDIAAYDLESGDINFLTSYYQEEEGISNITVSPVTGEIAFIKSDPELVGSFYEFIYTFCVLNPENGVVTEIYTFPAETLNIRGMDWSPDGDNVIFSARLGTLEQGFFRINVTDGSQPFLIYPELDPDFAPPLNPTYYDGGTRIAFADRLNGQDNWNIWSIDANGSDLQQITDTPGDETMRSLYRH